MDAGRLTPARWSRDSLESSSYLNTRFSLSYLSIPRLLAACCNSLLLCNEFQVSLALSLLAGFALLRQCDKHNDSQSGEGARW